MLKNCYLKIIYDLLYEQIELCGIARKCEKKYLDIEGNKVEKIYSSWLTGGMEMVHPNILLHIDETGFNLNDCND